MSAATLGYAETFSILLRRPNGGQIGSNAFDTAVSTLQREVVNDPDFSLLHASEQAVFGSIALMRRHNLNSTDAILVALLLDYARTPGAETCVMIAADRRLLRASAAEGMRTVNPEELAAADVPALVASV
jgi:hypothetical protein